MLGWELPPYNSGGLGVVSYELSKSLAESGATIDFIVPYDAEHDIDFMDIHPAHNLNPVEFREGFGAYASEQSAKYGTTVSDFDGLLHSTRVYAQAVADRIDQHEFDIIHVHDWLTLRAGIMAKMESGKPLIAHVHATQFDQAGGKRGNEAIHEIEAMGLGMADKILAVSQLTKDTIVREYGIDPDKIDVVHNEIDPTSYMRVKDTNPYKAFEELKTSGYKVITYLGRVTVQKGLWSLLQAFAKVVEQEPKTILLIAGNGEQINELQELAADLGISQNVVFSNSFVQGSKQRWAYRVAELFVMPSVSEPFGLTALEAPLQYTPVMISKQSGVAEVLRNALIVDHWDINQMANQMVACLRSEGLRTTLRVNSKREVMQMGWSRAATKVHASYRTVAA